MNGRISRLTGWRCYISSCSATPLSYYASGSVGDERREMERQRTRATAGCSIAFPGASGCFRMHPADKLELAKQSHGGRVDVHKRNQQNEPNSTAGRVHNRLAKRSQSRIGD